MVNKFNISGFISNCYLDKKIATSETKAELLAEQNKITELQTFDWSYFRQNKSNFEYDGTQNYLVFQPV